MIWVFFLIAMQAVIAAIVFFILKYKLSSELIAAALEKLQAGAIPPSEKQVTVQSAFELPPGAQAHIQSVIVRKSPQAKIAFEHDAHLKGGIIVEFSGGSLDFSVAGRLKNFWL